MPSKSISKAFFIIMSIAFASLLFGRAFAQDCDPSAGKQCYYYDELNRLKEVHYPDGTKIIYDYDELGNRKYMEQFNNPFTLTVQKAGTGTGTVTSDPEGIACGALCSKRFSSGTEVTLTPMPDARSVFTRWIGGGCSGTGACTVTLDANTTVTAEFTKYLALTVNKSGNGNGAVARSPAGENCGPNCEEYPPGTTVYLTATTADHCMTFTNWIGGCTGVGTSCSVVMTESKMVEAKFSWVQPTVDFTPVSQITGTAPFEVTFLDQSDCATGWYWDFGDSDPHATERTSTARFPDAHTYRLPETYSVTLTASNPDGSVTRNKSGLIVASPCYNYPAMIENTVIDNRYHATLTDAINNAVDGATIRTLAADLAGPISMGKPLTLNGGYNCDYSSVTTGATAIEGNVTIESKPNPFTVTMDNFLVD